MAVKPDHMEKAVADMIYQSEVVQLKSEAPIPRLALQVRSQNIVSPKETARVVPSIKASIPQAPKTITVLPEPFFAFLNKKIQVYDAQISSQLQLTADLFKDR